MMLGPAPLDNGSPLLAELASRVRGAGQVLAASAEPRDVA